MIRRPPRSTLDRSSAASDVYKRQQLDSASAMDDHHIVHRMHGGSNALANRVLLHPVCHRRGHAPGLGGGKPVFRTEGLYFVEETRGMPPGGTTKTVGVREAGAAKGARPVSKGGGVREELPLTPTFLEMLRDAQRRNGSMLCVGLDDGGKGIGGRNRLQGRCGKPFPQHQPSRIDSEVVGIETGDVPCGGEQLATGGERHGARRLTHVGG